MHADFGHLLHLQPPLLTVVKKWCVYVHFSTITSFGIWKSMRTRLGSPPHLPPPVLLSPADASAHVKELRALVLCAHAVEDDALRRADDVVGRALPPTPRVHAVLLAAARRVAN